ncbi:MAG: YiiX/YebB-like N1pC/P60 family cysteine hydrolase [Chthoniobacteraceae bacterium]
MKALLILLMTLSVGCTSAGTIPVMRTDGVARGRQDTAAGNLRQALPLLREGDIIFICFKHALYRRIAEISGSWESHVGILFRDSDGGWMVAASTIPVSKTTSLQRFVGRSENGRFLVRRLRGGLSPDAVTRLRAASDHRMGVMYDTGFRYDSPRQYCSKLVFDCYLEATGQGVGKVETFREMLAENPGAPVDFWRRWFFGRIPWERRCVTTTSQLHAANMITVFDSEIPASAADPKARKR